MCMENPFIGRYHSFCKNLSVLKQSCGADPNAMYVLGATAQAYNLTFDLSWKIMKDILVKFFGIQDFATGSPRETLRTAYSNQLISDDLWLKMLKVRNTLAHDYDGEVALKYFRQITTEFYQMFEQLKEQVAPYYQEGSLPIPETFQDMK